MYYILTCFEELW